MLPLLHCQLLTAMTAFIRSLFRVSCHVSFQIEAARERLATTRPLTFPRTRFRIVHASDVLSHADGGFELFAACGTLEVAALVVHLHNMIAEMIVAIVVGVAQLALEASIGVVHAALMLHKVALAVVRLVAAFRIALKRARSFRCRMHTTHMIGEEITPLAHLAAQLALKHAVSHL